MPDKFFLHAYWCNMATNTRNLTGCLAFSLLMTACYAVQEKQPLVKTKEQECSDTWIFKGNVSAYKLNDTVERQTVDGKLWFEIISPVRQKDGSTRAYIRNYRMDGSLESEGYATYFEHPVADYTAEGKWKYYDCKGKLLLP